MTYMWQVGARTVCVKSVASYCKTQGQHVAIPAAVLGPHEERQTHADSISLVNAERGWNACRRSGGACLSVCVGVCVRVFFVRGPGCEESEDVRVCVCVVCVVCMRVRVSGHP